MKYRAMIQQVVTRTYGTEVVIEADSQTQAREKAEDIAMDASISEIQEEWEFSGDYNSTWDVVELEEAA